jgi:hypothetical protein
VNDQGYEPPTAAIHEHLHAKGLAHTPKLVEAVIEALEIACWLRNQDEHDLALAIAREILEVPDGD